MRNVSMIMTRNEDTVDTVRMYMRRKGINTYAKALDMLVQDARQLGLHRRDINRSIIDSAMKLTDEIHAAGEPVAPALVLLSRFIATAGRPGSPAFAGDDSPTLPPRGA